MSNDLIDRLVADLSPVSARAVWSRLAFGIVAGALVAVALMWTWLGIRPDLAQAVATSSYWIKFFYTALIGTVGIRAVERLGRPKGKARHTGSAVGGIVVVTAAMAVGQLAALPTEAHTLVLGASARLCPFNIVAIAMPILVGGIWAVRGLAPTRLAACGSAIGLMAGGLAAWIYAFHCDEIGVAFLVLWYSAGIAVCALIGAATGRLVLCWR